MNKKVKESILNVQSSNGNVSESKIKNNIQKNKPTIIEYQNVNLKIHIKTLQNLPEKEASKNEEKSTFNDHISSNITDNLSVKCKSQIKRNIAENNNKKRKKLKENKEKEEIVESQNFNGSNKKSSTIKKSVKIKTSTKLLGINGPEKKTKKMKRHVNSLNTDEVQSKSTMRNSELSDINGIQSKPKKLKRKLEPPNENGIHIKCKKLKNSAKLSNTDNVQNESTSITNIPKSCETNDIKKIAKKSPLNKSKERKMRPQLTNTNGIQNKVKNTKKTSVLSATNGLEDESMEIRSTSSRSDIKSIQNKSDKMKNNSQLPHTNGIESYKNAKHKKWKKQKTENDTERVNTVLKSEMEKEKESDSSTSFGKASNIIQTSKKVHKLNINLLKEMLAAKERQMKKAKEKESSKSLTLRETMMNQLKASRFRYLNETLYNSESSESKQYFKDDPDAFQAYHEGYKQQVKQWPLNPLDVLISSIKKMPEDTIIADFGCGEARLAASVTHKVHSFDFVSLNKDVIACDMAHTPLLMNSVHVVVFCLSLMGTNLKDYIAEANRVLKKDGILKIAEVESRFGQVEDFISILSEYGFKNTWKDLSHDLFYFLDFKKERDIISGKKNKLSSITLKPCLYKKRTMYKRIQKLFQQ